jgi:hypothetical protein
MRAWGLALALAAILLSNPALAEEPAKEAPKAHEPTAGDLASARNALREGLALREKGDTNGALARLQSAWDFVPTPITGFELGKTHLMLGHVLQAHELFAKVGRIPPSLEESTKSQSARDESIRLQKEIASRIPSLHLKLTLPANATAVVTIDDEKVPLSGTEATRLVEVGPHDVVAKAGDGPEQKIHVEVAESEVKDVALAPQWIAPKPKEVVGPNGQVIYVRTTNPLTFVGFGFAAGALILTTISAIVFLDAVGTAQDLCGKSYCPPAKTESLGSGKQGQSNTNFNAEYTDAQSRYQTARALMLVGGGVMIIFGGIGAVFSQFPIKERVTAGVTVKPTFGLGGAGLTGTF